MQKLDHFIAGKLVEPADGTYLENYEPATGRVYSEVAGGGAEDVSRAVDAAAKAFPAWSTATAEERSTILLRIAELIDHHSEELARAESIDTGKPIVLARTTDIPRAAQNFRFFATAILHFHSESHATDTIALNYTLRRPRGVVGLISPWNLPLYLLSWKIAPAIAVGNTAVAKPSELAPMTAAKLAEICMQAGLPAGVLNIVHGLGQRAGASIVEHADVGTISFTGGTVTGAAIARTAAPKFKKLALELGGKNPNLIFADANMQEAVATSLRSSFANQGQICLCGSRILVEEAAYDSFLESLVAKTRALRIGDPLLEETDQGAVISAAHRQKVMDYIELARAEGGTVLCGGGAPKTLAERCREGYFVEPTVITGLDQDCRTNQEEIFGPVVTVAPFASDEEAIAQANATNYGLSATLWTQNLDRALHVGEKLQAGTVWINCWLLRDLRVPFGGMKQSGVGREGGVEALRFFTEPKNICLRYPSPAATEEPGS